MPDSKKFDPFKQVNPENALVIRAMDPWLAVWQQAIAYYWTVKGHDQFDQELTAAMPSQSKSHILFYILNKLGLKNMMLVPEDGFDDNNNPVGDMCVALLPFDAKGKTTPLDYPYPYLVKFKIAENLPCPTFNPAMAYLGAQNGWQNVNFNLTIKIPPLGQEPGQTLCDKNQTARQLTTLSDYVSFKGYFPFGHNYTTPYDYLDRNDTENGVNYVCSSLGLSLISMKGITDDEAKKANETKEELDAAAKGLVFIQGMQQVIFNTVQAGITETRKMAPPQAQLVGMTGVDTMAPGDRGGAPGMTGDFAWLYFVPRMISYNWSFGSFGTLKEGALLSNYTDMLNNFGYVIPQGLNITLRYANESPYNAPVVADDKECKEAKLRSLNQYVSTLSVILPEPPAMAAPMALANMIAKRADAPFTCG